MRHSFVIGPAFVALTVAALAIGETTTSQSAPTCVRTPFRGICPSTIRF